MINQKLRDFLMKKIFYFDIGERFPKLLNWLDLTTKQYSEEICVVDDYDPYLCSVELSHHEMITYWKVIQ